MRKIDRTVARETALMGAWVLVFSALMQAIFLVIGYWRYEVLLGNLLGDAAIMLNFFGMGMMVQNALGREEKEIKQRVRVSGALRMLMVFAILALGVVLPCFDTIAVLVPVLFPRVIVTLRPLWDKKRKGDENGTNEG